MEGVTVFISNIICIPAAQGVIMLLVGGPNLENQGLHLGRTARSHDTPWSTCLEKAKQVVVVSSASSSCPARCRLQPGQVPLQRVVHRWVDLLTFLCPSMVAYHQPWKGNPLVRN